MRLSNPFLYIKVCFILFLNINKNPITTTIKNNPDTIKVLEVNKSITLLILISFALVIYWVLFGDRKNREILEK